MKIFQSKTTWKQFQWLWSYKHHVKEAAHESRRKWENMNWHSFSSNDVMTSLSHALNIHVSEICNWFIYQEKSWLLYLNRRIYDFPLTLLLKWGGSNVNCLKNLVIISSIEVGWVTVHSIRGGIIYYHPRYNCGKLKQNEKYGKKNGRKLRHERPTVEIDNHVSILLTNQMENWTVNKH